MNHPKLYSKYNDLQKNDNLFVLDNFLCHTKWHKEGETVLDVGSGDGRFAVEFLIPRLPKNFGKYLGCDNSINMVNFAKENYGDAKIDFFTFDITSSEIPEEFVNGFDHIFSFYTLHWVRKQRQALQNMNKFLKSNGDVLLTFLASNPIYDVYRNMARHKRWKEYSKKDFIAPYHNSAEPEKQLHKVLVDSGFDVHVCKVENRTYTFPNMDIWRKSVMAVNAVIPMLRQDEISEYMQDFEAEVRKLKCVTIENLNNNEETIHIGYKLFIVHATKLTKLI